MMNDRVILNNPHDVRGGNPCASADDCNIITNGDFTDFHASLEATQTHYESFPLYGPNSSRIRCWIKSHGDPFMSRQGPGEEGLRHDAVLDAVMDGKTNGVLQFKPFEQGKMYFLQFRYQVIANVVNNIGGHTPMPEPFGNLDKLYIKFVPNPNLINAGFNLVDGQFLQVTTPSPPNSQLIGQINNIAPTAHGDLHTAYFCVRANANYDAIWFYPQQNSGTAHNSRIRIKNVRMYEASAGADFFAPCSGGNNVTLGQGCATIPGATYSWSPTTGLNNPNILNPALNTAGLANIQSGVQYTLTVNWNGCSVSDSVVITSNAPVLNMPQQIAICKDDLPILLNANPSNPVISFQWYMWNPITWAFEALPEANGQTYLAGAPGYYAVVANSGNNCTTTAYVGVYIQALPANLDTDFLIWAVGPSGQPTFQMYTNPAINPSAQGLFHAYYISEVNANFQNPQFVGVAWGNNGLQLLQYSVGNQVFNTFNRETYYEIKHGIWNECGDWTETRRYIYVD